MSKRPPRRPSLMRDVRRFCARRRSRAPAVVRVGRPDQFVEHGSVPILRAKHGITAEAAFEKIVAALPARKGIQVKPAAA